MTRTRLLRGAVAAALLATAVAITSPAAGSPIDAAAAPTAVGEKPQEILVTGPNGPFQLVFAHSGKCLDMPNFSTSNGTQAIQWTCKNQANQFWYLDYVSGVDSFRVRNAWSGKCLNIEGANYADLTPIIQWTCGDDANEYFRKGYDWVTGIPPGIYYWLESTAAPSKAVNITGASTADGAKAILYAKGNFRNEFVEFRPPRRSNGVKPVYFIHGYDGDSPLGYNCGTYWSQALSDYQNDGNPAVWARSQLKTVGFYTGDSSCDVYLPVDGVNRYGPVSQEGSRDESIRELGRELSWEIYNHYSVYGVTVDIVGHSMGGLIARAMLTGTQQNLSGWAPYVLVEDVSTLSTPHGGANAALLCQAWWTTTQCNELKPGSATLVWMDDNPQSDIGTDWTLIGAGNDNVVDPSQALGMCCVGHMINYPKDYWDNALINHGTIRSLTSGTFLIEFCDYFADCVMNYSAHSDWLEYLGQYDPVLMARRGNYYYSIW